MKIGSFLLLSIFLVFIFPAMGSSQEGEGQQFEGFNLQGFTDGGEKAWDVNGETADILWQYD